MGAVRRVPVLILSFAISGATMPVSIFIIFYLFIF